MALFLLSVAAAGCPERDTRKPAADGKTLAETKPAGPVTILVAASAQDAVREIAKGFTAETGIEVRISAGDSSKLAQQIESGAPADLFISANHKWAAYLLGKGAAVEAANLLKNSLVIIVPKGNPAGVKSPADLTKGAVKRVAVAGPTVPAGIYARQALTHAKVLGDLEAAKKIVAGEDVRSVLTYVDRGEADAGIVYATDAPIAAHVETAFTFPADATDSIVYELVLTRDGRANAAARKFAEHLQSPAASGVFRKFGFGTFAK